MIQVLILEPDPWRYRGLASVLKDSGKIEVLGEPDFGAILTLDSPPEELNPDLILLAQRLVMDYGISMVPHLRNLFPLCGVLVHGEHDSLETIAQLLAVGAAGFFQLSAPSGYLPTAVITVSKGKLWGPREAVALMARHATEKARKREGSEGVREGDLPLLQLLSKGLTNKQIAQQLGVAEATVKTRLTKLYKRFGVDTRLQLLSTVIQQGIVGPPQLHPQ